jgi:hypothetical protein
MSVRCGYSNIQQSGHPSLIHCLKHFLAQRHDWCLCHWCFLCPDQIVGKPLNGFLCLLRLVHYDSQNILPHLPVLN